MDKSHRVPPPAVAKNTNLADLKSHKCEVSANGWNFWIYKTMECRPILAK